MQLSYDETAILIKVCKEENIEFEMMKHIIMTVSEHYYGNNNSSEITDKILQDIQYWSK